MTDREIAQLAKKTLGQFNTPKAYRDLPMSQDALTFVTLPNGKVVTLSGFADERQIATVVRKHLRDLAPTKVEHVVVDKATKAVVEVRGTFIDNEAGISRRAI